MMNPQPYLDSQEGAERPIGAFFFQRGREREEVMVQTEFTDEELGDILNLLRADGPYRHFQEFLEKDSASGSGLGRRMQTDEFTRLPEGGTLRTKYSVLVRLNSLAATLSVLPTDFDSEPKHRVYFLKLFPGEESVIDAGRNAIIELLEELQSVLHNYEGWIVDLGESRPDAQGTVNMIRRKLDYMETKEI